MPWKHNGRIIQENKAWVDLIDNTYQKSKSWKNRKI